MRTRIACLPPAAAEVVIRRLADLAFYLADIPVESVYTEVTGEIAPNELDALFGTGVITVGETALDLGPSDVDVIAWYGDQEPPEWEVPVVRLADGDRSDNHVGLLKLAWRLRSATHRHALSAFGRLEGMRAQLGPDATVLVAAGDGPEPAEVAADLVITDDPGRLENEAESRPPSVLMLRSPETHVPAPSRPAERPRIDSASGPTLILCPDWAADPLRATWPELSDQVVGLASSDSQSLGISLHESFRLPAGLPSSAQMLLLAELIATKIDLASAPHEESDEALSHLILQMEKRGVVVRVHGVQAHPELVRRQATHAALELPAMDGAEFVTISVNPDWIDEMGHHAQYDRTLREEAIRRGGLFLSLTSKAQVPGSEFELPAFTHQTHGFHTAESAVFVASFESELGAALERLAAAYPGVPIQVIMFSAGIAHALAILRVAAHLDDDRLSFFVNLLRSRDELFGVIDGAEDSEERTLLELALRVGAGLRVQTMADTDTLSRELDRLAGFELPVWPLTSITAFPETMPPREQSDPITVCHAGTQEIKGIDTFALFAEAVAAGRSSIPMRLRARDTGHQPDWAARMAAAGVELTPGILTPDDYAAFMDDADIIVLPYKARPFRIHTSGVLADAIYLGRPLVATSDTWAGQLVAKHKIGTTFDEGDIEGFVAAVEDVARNYSEYHERMQAFAPNWLAANNTGSLLDTLQRAKSDGAHHAANAQPPEPLMALWDSYLDEARAKYRRTGRLVERLAAEAEHERLAERIATRDREIAQLANRLSASESRRRLSIAELAMAKKDLAGEQERHVSAEARLKTRIETREGTIAHLKQAVGERDDKLASARDSYETRIATLKEGVAKRDAELARLRRRLSVRFGNVVRRLLRRR